MYVLVRPRAFRALTFPQPVGVGFSYGTHVNNSVDAAYDAYDFLVKFMALFPHLAGYVLSSISSPRR